MNDGYLKVEQSHNLYGEVELSGAKNAVLVIIASLLLTRGKSVLLNVPRLVDVFGMMELLQCLGATVFFDENTHELIVDTSLVNNNKINVHIMQKMRTSVLAMGPLLAQYGSVIIEGMPGGDDIGKRPIDYHIKNFIKMGVSVIQDGDTIHATVNKLHAQKIVLEYPSVGATENILMLATRTTGITYIVNAALEPEVIDLISVLRKMGATIAIKAPATIVVEGVDTLVPIEHTVMYDRLEAGSLLIAAAATGGEIYMPHVTVEHMDVFLYKLEEMGHSIIIDEKGKGIHFKSTKNCPKAISFKTSPYPGFPTDLQAPMMALQTTAQGQSNIEETVFENRFLHIAQLQKMGACIAAQSNKALITGIQKLQGIHVLASDIRAAMALVIAGLMAEGETMISGIYHWKRGYDSLEQKLAALGAKITLHDNNNYSELFLSHKKNPDLITR